MKKKSTFFTILFFACLVVCNAQDGSSFFPVIKKLNYTDDSFKQYINDVENNRRRIARYPSQYKETAEHLTIYQYTAVDGEDIFFLAARCNMPYSALASLNRLANNDTPVVSKTLLLPSCPGLFLPGELNSELEMLLGAARQKDDNFVEIKISIEGKSTLYYFYPGADFTQTERSFFLNPGFRFPIRTYRLTSGYGMRVSPISGSIVMHHGLDLAAPEGTNVYAAAEGTVTETGYDNILGNFIVIKHKNGLTSVYGHLLKIETYLNTTVNSSTLIGKVGSTGQSTGPHLHFELRQDGKSLNPTNKIRSIY